VTLTHSTGAFNSDQGRLFRLSARELERRFENALQGLQEIESKARAQVQQILKTYAEQLPRLWHAATTAAQERKRMVRCLIETVVVTASFRLV